MDRHTLNGALDGGWGDGEMGRWGDGEMGRWGDGEIKTPRNKNKSAQFLDVSVY
ncbi:hypothetical protein [Okeania sp. SIO1I7]|uniref:hypothetical protein n=1 Tax=Okeania sp. SIO1I7 TaxID=2607772 RepID=UPI0013F8DDC9|nr:hypothetical protein [Okeania sp. SIO1I7]NET26878.1 hypothetical protein [Okeania sp. SIO1I7]